MPEYVCTCGSNEYCAADDCHGATGEASSAATSLRRYSTIVADPPWPYKTPGGGPLQSSPAHRPNSWQNDLAGVGSEKRYGVLTIEDICALAPPVAHDAHLYLWTTNAFMVEAHEVAKAWGFRPITVCTWVKMKPDGTPSMKTGYYFRGATEHFLFCVRGSLRLQTTKAYPTAFLWPRAGNHSEKPAAFYDLAEECSPGPRLELFARIKRLGWDVWGNEVDSDVELVA
jgi:N6-adenosine-specific RNA methylase IME4